MGNSSVKNNNRLYSHANNYYHRNNGGHTVFKLAFLIIFIATALAVGLWLPSLFQVKEIKAVRAAEPVKTGQNVQAQTVNNSAADVKATTATAAGNDGSKQSTAQQDISAPKSGYWIKIVKQNHKLFVMNGRNPQPIASYSVALGSNTGQKKAPGDRRTPEGNFSIQAIQNAGSWSHDFKDGKGVIEHAYGPWFIRLKTPWSGIGIHGTHNPDSIGHNVTEGCIRLNNNDLETLKRLYIKVGSKVVIVDR